MTPGSDHDGPPAGIIIRPETPQDSAAIHAVVADAFGDNQVADLVDALRASPDWIPGLSFVAVERHDAGPQQDRGPQRDPAGERVVGHLLFTRSRLDTPTRLIDVLQLSPLSVAADRRRRGVGSALVHHGLAAVAALGYPLVFLEGSPEYYAHFGFVAAGPRGFRRPSLRIPPAAFQVYPLGGYRPWMTGTLIYSDVFWRYDSVGLRDEDGTVWPD